MRFQALIHKFGDSERAYKADYTEIAKVIGKQAANSFSYLKSHTNLNEKLNEFKKRNIEVLTYSDKKYPDLLKNISDPPIALYIKGSIDILNSEYTIGIVGTRKPSSYGAAVARKFASDLSCAGFTIVSGLALGIDAISHRSTLEAGGKTIAVLGCGVDVIYPAFNKQLYWDIVNQGGAVISEFPPGHTVLKGLFVARNRIISGLCKGVIVVEGLKESGALITARYAGEQGREVFAPPAPLTSDLSEAPNGLLKNGAKLITSITDILDEFQISLSPKSKNNLYSSLAGQELEIFSILSQEPATIDDLKIRLGDSIGSLLQSLSMLEIKGIVEKDTEGKYQLKYS